MSKDKQAVTYRLDGTKFTADDGMGGPVAMSVPFMAAIAFTTLDGLLRSREGCTCSSCSLLRVARTVLGKQVGMQNGDGWLEPQIDKSKLC